MLNDTIEYLGYNANCSIVLTKCGDLNTLYNALPLNNKYMSNVLVTNRRIFISDTFQRVLKVGYRRRTFVQHSLTECRLNDISIIQVIISLFYFKKTDLR